jgi:predicted small metal-binding protein
MKSLACSDMGMECSFSAEAETADEVKAKMLAHAQEVHAEMLAGMTEEEKAGLVAMMDEKMVTTP